MAEAQIEFYDYAKQLAANEKPMDPIAANLKYLEMGKFIKSKEYTMLLSNERRDFSVFHNDPLLMTPEGVAKVLKEYIDNRGILLLADKQEDGNYEIWLRDPDTKENVVYYLFDYSNAVEEV